MIKIGTYVMIVSNGECHCGNLAGIGKVARIVGRTDNAPHEQVWEVVVPQDEETWELCEDNMKVVDQQQGEFIFKVRDL